MMRRAPTIPECALAVAAGDSDAGIRVPVRGPYPLPGVLIPETLLTERRAQVAGSRDQAGAVFRFLAHL